MTKSKSTFLDLLLRILRSQSGKVKQHPNRKKRRPERKKNQKTSEKKEEHSSQLPKSSSPKPMVQTILSEAEKLLGTPYRYGGTSPGEGFDCSGLVYHVFRKAGLKLQRTSYLQSEEGQTISVPQTAPGDLIFFAHSGDRINHVGIVTSKAGEPLAMIHASSSKGVIHTNVAASKYWQTRLKGARRMA